jgi:hypothetical protein
MLRAPLAAPTGSRIEREPFVAQALDERVKLAELALRLDEMLAETGGPLTAAEKRSAEAALGVRPRRRRSAA